jgi:hypothetical protein
MLRDKLSQEMEHMTAEERLRYIRGIALLGGTAVMPSLVRPRIVRAQPGGSIVRIAYLGASSAALDGRVASHMIAISSCRRGRDTPPNSTIDRTAGSHGTRRGRST